MFQSMADGTCYITLPARVNVAAEDWLSGLAHELMHAIGFRRNTFEPSLGEERIAELGAEIICRTMGWPYVDWYQHRDDFGRPSQAELIEMGIRLHVWKNLCIN